MLVDAAGERPGRALGTNGVCGNLGVAVAPVLTAALAVRFGWHSAFILPGLVFVASGAAWRACGAVRGAAARAARPFPAIPPPWCGAP